MNNNITPQPSMESRMYKTRNIIQEYIKYIYTHMSILTLGMT